MYNNYGYGMMPQRYEILHVSGRAGAEALAMAPNSSALLWDDTDAIIWIAQSDSAGYKSLQALDVSPHVDQQPIDSNALIDRLCQLENKFTEWEAKYESTTANAQQQ